MRISIAYDGHMRTLFWFKLGKDGSVYFGAYHKPATGLAWAALKTVGGRVNITKADWTEVTDPARIKDTHVSLHASGETHIAGRTYMSAPIKDLSEQVTVCGILFQHPSRYPLAEPNKPGTLDIELDYPIDEGRMLMGELLVAPQGKERYVTSPEAQFQANLIIQCTGFDDGINRSLHFVLYHTTESKWLEATQIIMPPNPPLRLPRVLRALDRLLTRWFRGRM